MNKLKNNDTSYKSNSGFCFSVFLTLILFVLVGGRNNNYVLNNAVMVKAKTLMRIQ